MLGSETVNFCRINLSFTHINGLIVEDGVTLVLQ